MSVFVAARTLGDIGAWRLTNLTMQKILYVAQMLHLGRFGAPLFEEHFEAWDYGPVVPAFYRFAKKFKGDPIQPFHSAGFKPVSVFDPASTQHMSIEDAFALTGHLTSGQLVQFTHRDGGAWASHYESERMGVVIPNADILSEFQKFMRASSDAVAWAEQMADDIAGSPSRYLGSKDERALRDHLLAGRLQ